MLEYQSRHDDMKVLKRLSVLGVYKPLFSLNFFCLTLSRHENSDF
jgi:hypothetical protein